MGAGIRVDGLKELSNDFRKMRLMARPGLQRGLLEIGADIRDTAAELTPHRTEEAGIHVRSKRLGATKPPGATARSWRVHAEKLDVQVGSDDPAADWLEHGTIDMPAEPSLMPAMEAEKPRVRELLRQHMGPAFDRVAGR